MELWNGVTRGINIIIKSFYENRATAIEIHESIELGEISGLNNQFPIGLLHFFMIWAALHAFARRRPSDVSRGEKV